MAFEENVANPPYSERVKNMVQRMEVGSCSYSDYSLRILSDACPCRGKRLSFWSNLHTDRLTLAFVPMYSTGVGLSLGRRVGMKEFLDQANRPVAQALA